MTYATVALVPPMYSTMDVWRGITYVLTARIHSSVKFVGLPLATHAMME